MSLLARRLSLTRHRRRDDDAPTETPQDLHPQKSKQAEAASTSGFGIKSCEPAQLAGGTERVDD